MVPLFSLRRDGDWGVGDFGQLGEFAAWTASAGHRRIQLLPLGEIPAGERSPYSALSAFALDPIYVDLDALEDFAGGVGTLPASAQVALDAARAASGIDYVAVRNAKQSALRIAFDAFERAAGAGASARAGAFEAFCRREAGWLEGYTLYRACAEARHSGAWQGWEPALASADAGARSAALATTTTARRFHAWVQWIAQAQYDDARRAAAAHGVALDGDLPFMVAADSADVWLHQAAFDLGASLGAPPDEFNRDGQDWRLPPYDFPALGADGFGWLRARLARTGALFSGCRIDHVVGCFRQWVRPVTGAPGFVPPDPAAQRALGEAVLAVIQDAAPDLRLTAEDLGDVPDFVREVLAARRLPGYRVMRWEWDGGVPRDPRGFPACSVATWGTHDTSSLATWWSAELDDAGRVAIASAPGFEAVGSPVAECSPAVHAGLLDALYAAGSEDVLVPFPDAYGGVERINLPGTVSDANWGYRLPWTLGELQSPAGRTLAEALRRRAERSGRLA